MWNNFMSIQTPEHPLKPNVEQCHEFLGTLGIQEPESGGHCGVVKVLGEPDLLELAEAKTPGVYP